MRDENKISCTQLENLAKLYVRKHGKAIDFTANPMSSTNEKYEVLLRIIDTGESFQDGLKYVREQKTNN